MKGRKRVGEDRAHPILHTAANAAEHTTKTITLCIFSFASGTIALPKKGKKAPIS